VKITIGLVLLVVALVLFALAAIGVKTGVINTLAADLFFWALSTLF